MPSTQQSLRYDPHATLAVQSRNVEYLRHGDQPLLMRVYQPEGQGPFPAAIALHGGAWGGKEWLQNEDSHVRLAQGGLVTAALQFRTSQDAPHPAAQEDIHYATRWMKLHATEFNATADGFGGIGWSSGGHQVLLAAMKHRDFATIPLEGGDGIDGSLAWVLMGWPVLDAVGRYHLAEEAGNEALMARHLAYFGSLEGMETHSPPYILERGEPCDLPPALILQGAQDQLLPRMMSERFVEAYSLAGGVIELGKYPCGPHPFMREATPYADMAFEQARSFIARHAG
jgi:acetyl esterase